MNFAARGSTHFTFVASTRSVNSDHLALESALIVGDESNNSPWTSVKFAHASVRCLHPLSDSRNVVMQFNGLQRSRMLIN